MFLQEQVLLDTPGRWGQASPGGWGHNEGHSLPSTNPSCSTARSSELGGIPGKSQRDGDGWRQLQAGLAPVPPQLPRAFPGELAPGPDSGPVRKVQHQLRCQQQEKHPVGRALNGSRKGKDKELVSFQGPRRATLASLTGRGCKGSTGEVIYRNVVNYRHLLCKKVGTGPQQLGGEQGRGAEPAFPRKTGTTRIPAQSGTGDRGQGTR